MVIGFGCVLMVSLTFISQDYTRRTSIAEAVRIEAEMGSSTLRKVNALADTWYLGIRRVLKSNVVLSAEDFYSDDTLQRKREEQFLDTLLERTHEGKLANWLIEREQAMLDLLYWVLRRVALFVVLLPLWIPMAVLALFHGLQREFPSNLYCAPHTEGRGTPTLSKIANCF